jgi:hypothetical protein
MEQPRGNIHFGKKYIAISVRDIQFGGTGHLFTFCLADLGAARR